MSEQRGFTPRPARQGPPTRRRGVESVGVRMVRRLLLFALVIAGATADAAAGPNTQQRRKQRGSGKNKNRCSVGRCKRCVRGDKNQCEVCHNGYAVTEEKQCAPCGQGCSLCHQAGPSSCDTCQKGYTLVTSFLEKPQCEKCAPHCDNCDTAGAGKCNECKTRHMLTYTLPAEPGMPEIHECVPCAENCKSCSFEEGCTACELFFALKPHGTGCAFSWWRLALLLICVFVPVGACIFACMWDEMAENERIRAREAATRPRPSSRLPNYDRSRDAATSRPSERDRTEVVRGEDESKAQLRSRRSGGPKPLAHMLREGSYPPAYPPAADIPLAAAHEEDVGYAAAAAVGSRAPFGRAAASDDGLGGGYDEPGYDEPGYDEPGYDDVHGSNDGGAVGTGRGQGRGATGIDDLLQHEGPAVRKGATLAA